MDKGKFYNLVLKYVKDLKRTNSFNFHLPIFNNWNVSNSQLGFSLLTKFQSKCVRKKSSGVMIHNSDVVIRCRNEVSYEIKRILA